MHNYYDDIDITLLLNPYMHIPLIPYLNSRNYLLFIKKDTYQLPDAENWDKLYILYICLIALNKKKTYILTSCLYTWHMKSYFPFIGDKEIAV